MTFLPLYLLDAHAIYWRRLGEARNGPVAGLPSPEDDD